MEELRPARRSSGIYEQLGPSLQGSSTSLAANAAAPAGSQAPNNGSQQQQQQKQQKVPFWKKRKFIITMAILIPLGIALLFIILFPVVTAIVQSVVNKGRLHVEVASISAPQNNSFQLDLQGFVTHTGVIPARIRFTEPIRVSWVQDDDKTETPIGTMTLDTLRARHKRAYINQTTTFTITDEDAFGRFAEHMITASNFTWRMRSSNLNVQAAKFPESKGIKFNKKLTLNGFDSFQGNVRLLDLQLPSDNPAGGINFAAKTELSNPSPFSLNLGTVVFALSYRDLDLGTGSSDNTVIGPGSNNITLQGYLKTQSGDENLEIMSELFTNYINGDNSPVVATGQSTLQSDGTVIAWLSQGLRALHLDVPFKPLSPISPIKSISIGDFALQFFQASPWTPSVESRTVQATMELPFGFDVAIGQITNEFNITKDGQTVAGLKTPEGAATSDISVFSETNTAGTINISITDTNLSCAEPFHPSFSSFNTELTTLDRVPFQLTGKASAVANTSVGQIVLDPIKVNVTTSLDGMQGLKGLTSIDAPPDVQGGTEEGITLAINVTINNPSNLKLNTGDLKMQLFRDDALLGTALMPNLTLEMGSNSIVASSVFDPNSTPEGMQTLNDFVSQKDVQVSIAGYDESTEIAPLLEAFKSLDLGLTLPGLKTRLLDTAALKVLPTTGRENNISHVTVDVNNPFSAALQITKIHSTVSSKGVPLGSIDSTTEFSSKPKSTTTSPELDLNMNFDPNALFTVTRALALEAGEDVAPLDGLVELGGYHYLDASDSESTSKKRHDRRQADLYRDFDLPNFVKTAFSKLQSDVELTSDVTIGDYSTVLTYSQSAVDTNTDDSVTLILPVLAQPIVQKIVDGSVLGISTVTITDPAQESFGAQLKGLISNAGPFDAQISFGDGLIVSWQGKPLGQITMDPVDVVGDVGADIEADSSFQVADIDHLTEFTKVLLTQESFEWEISCNNLTVSALGISVSDVALPTKKVSLKGFNGLKGGVHITTFDLPSDDPDGGIHLTLQATTENPSQVGIELSSIGFETYVGDIMVAPVLSDGAVILAPQSTSNLSLVGRLVPQDTDEGLAAVSELFNNFVHDKDSDVTVHGASAGPSEVSWLNEGIEALQVDTVLPSRGPLTIIQSISLNEMTLVFTEDTAYAPLTSSKSTDAAFDLPFGFPLDITAVQQTIAVSYNGDSFAELAIPRGPSDTDVEQRILHLTFEDVPFTVFGDKHSTFENFLVATTMGSTQELGLSGSADTEAQTAVGLLSLTGISFDVRSSIDGLQGLNTERVTTSDLDVNHGYPDFLLITVDANIVNPSNLTIGTGDVSFGLQYKSTTIGSANIDDLIITPGNQSYGTDVHYAPQGDAVSAGRELLQNFIQGVDVDTSIVGSADSTRISSLKNALSQIRLSPVTIPALHETLIKSASLSFPTDIVQTGVAQSSFTLANPFTASINLLRVGAVASYHGLTLGEIKDVDVSSNPIRAEGHSSVTSQDLPLQYNLDPSTIVRFLSIAAEENGVDLGPLVEIFQFILDNPDYDPPIETSVDTNESQCRSGQQFNVEGAILGSLENLRVDLGVDSSVKLDDFATDLSFDQKSVPAITDETALYLIGAVAAPVAQSLVDGAALEFFEANITNISDEGFDLSLRGSLTNVGPLDALITFVEPVTVTWEGQAIAQIELPPVCAAANSGVPDYRTSGHLSITDLGKFTEFATFLLHNPSFEWTISTDKLRLTALGTIFDGVSLTKSVSFKAFNNLPGVSISNFELPSDDPAGGIHIETDALIPSPAQLGIDMGTVSFNAFFEDTLIGPLSGNHLFLAAATSSETHLSGRMIPQSDASNLDTIGKLFSAFLAGENQTLITKGDSVQPDGSDGPVSWLSDAFKTLSLEVILPGQQFDVIQSIELVDLAVTIEELDQSFSPPTSSESTLAKYKNPFGFSLQVFRAAQSITMSVGDTDAAELDLPETAVEADVSTGNVANLKISWQDQPLVSVNDAAFAAMFSTVTNEEQLNVVLKGSADVRAHTAVGDVPISGISFEVESGLKGINAFGGSAILGDVVVTGSGGDGGNEYVTAELTTTLENPSNISLSTLDTALPVYYEGVKIGRAAISPFELLPGENDMKTEFRYKPDNANDTVAQAFLTSFITTSDELSLTIDGDEASTPFPSLKQAMAAIQLSTSLKGLNHPEFITHINVFITLDSLITNLVSINFDVQNPLDASLTILFAQADAGLDGEIYAHFEQSFDGFTIQPGETVNSETFGNVLLTKGALASLDIIPRGVLDSFTAVSLQVGEGGYTIPWMHLNQDSIPTTYTLDLGGVSAMREKAKEISSSSAARTATSSSEVESRSSFAAATTSKDPGEETTTTPTGTSASSESTNEPDGGDENTSSESALPDLGDIFGRATR